MKPINYAYTVNPKDDKSVIEDQILIDEKSQTFVVIDGVGSSSGAVASEFAINSLNRAKSALTNLLPQELIALANDNLLEENQKSQDFITKKKPMLASIAIAQIRDNYLHYANLGDSRVMYFRAGKLSQLTKDHTLLQDEIDKAYDYFDEKSLLKSPLRHVLTRSLGEINYDYPHGKIRIYEKDIILMCSDGLIHFVLHSVIEKTIADLCFESINHRSDKIVEKLKELAKESKDDLSLIVISL